MRDCVEFQVTGLAEGNEPGKSESERGGSNVTGGHRVTQGKAKMTVDGAWQVPGPSVLSEATYAWAHLSDVKTRLLESTDVPVPSALPLRQKRRAHTPRPRGSLGEARGGTDTSRSGRVPLPCLPPTKNCDT